MDIGLQEISEWKLIREKVKNNNEYNSDWNKAIDLFETRLNRKFFNPLGELIKQKKQKGEGFTIVTTQCALVESLASFRKGQIFNHQKNKNSPIFEYNSSGNMFVEFLQTDEIFENNFWTIENGKKKENFPFSADRFYSDVRCGLMHEARTKNEWFINTTKKKITTAKIFIVKEGNKTKILRSILHYRLKSCVKKYCADLKENDNNGEKLRKLFGRKLDHLFDIKRDLSYDWWK
jgi:hypothetical protein